MSTVRNHTIIVSCRDQNRMKNAHAKAMEIFRGELVSPLIDFIANGGSSFFIAPDGSKEWWPQSNACDKYRSEFVKWLREVDPGHIDWVEVSFGYFGYDDLPPEILRSNEDDR